jgi:hypothetical protein
MNVITGKARSKIKSKIRSMKHQKSKYDSLSDLEKLKLKDLENELKRKCGMTKT